MADTITNILLVGVGGQGILLASEILSEACMLAGHDVKKSEIHGMSQRGGSVISHVRFGREVFSPIVPEGEGDILFGFELLETYRYLPFLKTGGAVVANELQIQPPGVLLGTESYPENLPGKIPGNFFCRLFCRLEPFSPFVPVRHAGRVVKEDHGRTLPAHGQEPRLNQDRPGHQKNQGHDRQDEDEDRGGLVQEAGARDILELHPGQRRGGRHSRFRRHLRTQGGI